MAQLEPSPIDVYDGPFSEAEATRLLWRAGFGPTRGQARALVALGMEGAVASLTRPSGPAELVGAAPTNQQGQPLDPINVYGDLHTWWIDRMVRSSQSCIERMTLVWHSWFATSLETSSAQLMLDQNWMMRGNALGNFHTLLLDVTADPAMLLWLSGSANNKYSPNENYGREMMELFTLGSGRGYSQHDVHQQARALTGFTSNGSGTAAGDFKFDPTLHDDGVKTIFGHRGRFDWRDSCRLCVEHPLHPSFMINKLWNYFVGAPPPAEAMHGLEAIYRHTGHQIRPLMEAILRHPLFYEGPRMVLPPSVYVAGMMRATGQSVTTDQWAWLGQQMGQVLFDPPNVGGWDYTHWLDTARWAGRLSAASYALVKRSINTNGTDYSKTETPSQAVASAMHFWGNPALSSTTHDNLLAFSRRAQRGITADWEEVQYRILRQNALRSLIPITPEWQSC